MNAQYRVYGAPFSYYSAKTRCQLIQQRIPYREINTTAWTYMVMMPRRVGAAVVPVVQTPEGEWLQDSSEIFDRLQGVGSAPKLLPAAPELRFAAYLFELWGDEFLLPLAMHTRWNRPQHLPWYSALAGSVLLPHWPGFAQRWMGRKIASGMRAHVATLGFDSAQTPVLDRFGAIQLDGLNTHFADHRFLFGERPSLGDLGLAGPLLGHIGHDPLSKQDLVLSRPHLAAWVSRMSEASSTGGADHALEALRAPSLAPAVQSIMQEMLPFVAACAGAVRRLPAPKDGDVPPRFLEQVTYPLAGGEHRRAAPSYVVWMAQRILNAYRTMPDAEQAHVRHWLDSVGGSAWLELDLPPMRRVGLAAARVA